MDMTHLPPEYMRMRLTILMYAPDVSLVNEFDQRLVSGRFAQSDASFSMTGKRVEFGL